VLWRVSRELRDLALRIEIRLDEIQDNDQKGLAESLKGTLNSIMEDKSKRADDCDLYKTILEMGKNG